MKEGPLRYFLSECYFLFLSECALFYDLSMIAVKISFLSSMGL